MSFKKLSLFVLLLSSILLSVVAAPSKKHHSKAAGQNVVVGYFPNWLGSRYSVSDIDFTKYTHIHYAFAIMTKGDVPEWTDDNAVDSQLPALVSAAHKSNAKVLISVGGWTGSISFSSMAKDSSSRKSFIDWNIDQIKKYDTDGVDIDWEYPGRQGAGCNVVDEANDVKNFQTLLSELREALDSSFPKGSKELTIAGHVGGMSGASSLGDFLDRVNIMSYDINGAWNPQTGPNAPLEGGISFNSGIEAWIAAGVPANKLTGGLAFYGRSTTAKENMLKSNGSINQDQVQSKPPKGDSFDAPFQDPYCSKDPGGLSGIWRFGSLLSEGVLDSPLTAKAPWVRNWDDASSTPWLFNPDTKVFISYDDPKSIAAKVASAKSKGLAGVMVWSVDQDSESGDLLKAIVN